MKIFSYALAAAVTLFAAAACGEKKKSDIIIAPTVEPARPQAPVRMQNYTQERSVEWLGRSYRLSIVRQPSDSLPTVTDETGQQFVDNTISVRITRADGSVFFSRSFTKRTFEPYLDDDYRRTGILEGLVFDEVDGDMLDFAASVSHPQTDEYIPFEVKVSRFGDVTIHRDTQMDTNGESNSDTNDDDDEDGV